MDRATLAETARQHWERWLPEKTAELKANGEFAEAIQGAAALAQKEISDLMAQGYPEHAAMEVALKDYILLTPEPDPDDWESRELAEKEAAYQDMMREAPEPDA